MFGFLKKLFGGDAETNKAAGVQIEQVPYKTEPPVLDKITTVNTQPIEKPAVAEPKPAVITAVAKPAEKKAAAKKPAARKPAAKKAPAKKKAAK